MFSVTGAPKRNARAVAADTWQLVSDEFVLMMAKKGLCKRDQRWGTGGGGGGGKVKHPWFRKEEEPRREMCWKRGVPCTFETSKVKYKCKKKGGK